MKPNLLRIAATLLLAATWAGPALGEAGKTPYWASINVEEVNMRVGPGEDYRIAWVYHRKQLPLKVLRLKEGWRFVEDHDGTRGWMLAQFLSRKRTAIVRGEGPADMRETADVASKLRWRLAPGVTGVLGACEANWCEFDIEGRKGHVPQDRLWGAGEP